MSALERGSSKQASGDEFWLKPRYHSPQPALAFWFNARSLVKLLELPCFQVSLFKAAWLGEVSGYRPVNTCTEVHKAPRGFQHRVSCIRGGILSSVGIFVGSPGEALELDRSSPRESTPSGFLGDALKCHLSYVAESLESLESARLELTRASCRLAMAEDINPKPEHCTGLVLAAVPKKTKPSYPDALPLSLNLPDPRRQPQCLLEGWRSRCAAAEAAGGIGREDPLPTCASTLVGLSGLDAFLVSGCVGSTIYDVARKHCQVCAVSQVCFKNMTLHVNFASPLTLLVVSVLDWGQGLSAGGEGPEFPPTFN